MCIDLADLTWNKVQSCEGLAGNLAQVKFSEKSVQINTINQRKKITYYCLHLIWASSVEHISTQNIAHV